MKHFLLVSLSFVFSASSVCAQTFERTQGSTADPRTITVIYDSDKTIGLFEDKVKSLLQKAKDQKKEDEHELALYNGWEIFIEFKDPNSPLLSLKLKVESPEGELQTRISGTHRNAGGPKVNLRAINALPLLKKFTKLATSDFKGTRFKALDRCVVGSCSKDDSTFWKDTSSSQRLREDSPYVVTLTTPDGKAKTYKLQNSIGAAFSNAYNKGLDTQNRWTRNTDSFCIRQHRTIDKDTSEIFDGASLEKQRELAGIYNDFISELREQTTPED